MKKIIAINRTNLILLGVLAVQIVLTILMFIPRTSASTESNAPLLKDFNADEVVGLSITDAEKKQLVFAKTSSGQWVIPNADDYPVSNTVITTMLDKLTKLTNSRVVAQSSANYNRLKVGEDAFERIVEVKRANKTDRLIMGNSTSTGGYVRLNDDPNVYLTNGLPTYEVSVDTDSYIDADASYFAVTKEQVTSIRIDNPQGTFQFRKVNDTWVWEGLAPNELLNTGALDSYINQFLSVRLKKALGKTEQDSYGIKNPSATVVINAQVVEAPQITPTVRVDVPGLPTPTLGSASPVPPTLVDKTYTLLIGAKQPDENYAIKSSESPYYVEIAGFNAETFVNLKRSDLVAPATSTPEPSATPLATATPIASPTAAVTATPTEAATPTASATP